MEADLILHNAKVLTLDPSFPTGEMVAVWKGKICWIGKKEKLEEFKGPRTMLLDCCKGTILPGFIDAHCHLYGFAESLVNLNLRPMPGLKSVQDILAKIRAAAIQLPPGTWIRAAGYHEFHLTEGRHPTRWDLDKVAPHHPVKITHLSGHAHVLNSLALKSMDICRETPDPPGGVIDRNWETGEPTGLFFGMGDFLARRMPPLDSRDMERGLQLANQKLLSRGITSLQEASARNGRERWMQLEQAKRRGIIKPRLSMMLGLEAFESRKEKDFLTHLSTSHLRLGPVKMILQETTGQLSPSQEELNQKVLKVQQAGFQSALHALEERTVEAACSAVEFTLQNSPRKDHRHRIEHCSVCPSQLAKRLANLGILVVTQPSFVYYHGERYLRTVPEEELKYLYPLATFLKNGVRIAAGSDVPVAPVDPLMGIFAATTRRAESGELLFPEERISTLEAIKMYTIYAARANFEERRKGSITPGKLADLVVLKEDPTSIPHEEIKNIEVHMTILDGKVVWPEEITR